MATLIIDLPEAVIRGLQGMAATQHKSVEQLAAERLSSLVIKPEASSGTSSELLKVIAHLPTLDPADVDELDAAIASGRIPIRDSHWVQLW